MQRFPLESYLAGLLCGLLYALINSGAVISGPLAFFLPLLPLFWSGFRFGPAAMAFSLVLGLITVCLTLGLAVSVLLFFLHGLPALIIVRCALTTVPIGGERKFLPVGWVLLRALVYQILFFIALYWLAVQQGNTLQGLLLKDISASGAVLDPALQIRMEEMAKSYPFILFGGFGWLWSLMFFATAWFGHFVTETFRPVLRPSFRLEPFPLPTVLPVLLMLLILAGFIGSDAVQIMVWTVALQLGYIYFLYGAAKLHAIIGTWKQAHTWYWIYYPLFVLTFFYWTPLFVTWYGFFSHLLRISGWAAKPPARNGQ